MMVLLTFYTEEWSSCSLWWIKADNGAAVDAYLQLLSDRVSTDHLFLPPVIARGVAYSPRMFPLTSPLAK